jgi:hypothetical protein
MQVYNDILPFVLVLALIALALIVLLAWPTNSASDSPVGAHDLAAMVYISVVLYRSRLTFFLEIGRCLEYVFIGEIGRRQAAVCTAHQHVVAHLLDLHRVSAFRASCRGITYAALAPNRMRW